MKIKSIELKNFLVHEYSLINFVDGINIITGQNGSGKSSIIEAICFCLFGKPIYHNKKEDLIRYGQRDFLIKMIMNNSQRDFIIERRSSTFSTNLYGIDGPNSLKEYLSKNFNINYKRYISTLLIKQKSIDEFIRATPRERMKEFEKIIGIDNYKKIMDVNQRIIKEYEGYIKGFDYFKKKSDLEEIERKISQIELENEQRREKKENLEKNLNGLKNKKKRLEEAKELYKKLKDIENYEGRYKEIENEIEKGRETFEKYEKYKQIYRQAIETKSAYEEIKRIENELQAIEKNKEGYEKYQIYLSYVNNEKINEMESMVKRGKELKQKIEEVLGKIENSTNLIEIINEEKNKKQELLARREIIIQKIGEINNQISQNQKILIELKSAYGNCPICKRPLDENHKKNIIQEAQKSINDLNLEKQKLEIELKNIDKDLSEVEERLKYEPSVQEYVKLKENFNKNYITDWEKWKEVKNYKSYEENYKIYSQKSAFEKRKVELENKIKEWNYDYGFQDVISFVEENREFYENYLSKLKIKSDLEAKINEKNEILSKLENYRDVDFENLDFQIKQIEQEIQIIINQIGELEGEIRASQRTISELEDTKKGIEQELREYEKKKHHKEIYEELNDRLINLITFERKRSYENLKTYVQYYFDKFNLSDYKSIEIEFSEEKLDIFLKNDSGYDINVNSLSGGEKTALSLAMRLAIAQMLDIKFKIFILDEPTDGMDNERIESLGELFYNFIKSNPDYQLIIITHEEEIAQMGYYRIHLERKSNRSFVSYI